MTALDPKAAADKLRPMLKANPIPAVPPDKQNQEHYLEKVCEYLDLEPTVHNQTFVAGLLVKAEIEPHFADEYPKSLNFYNKRTRKLVPAVYAPGHANAGLPVVFDDDDDEKGFDKSTVVPDVPVPDSDDTNPSAAYADFELFDPGVGNGAAAGR